MILTRLVYVESGIFGSIQMDDGKTFCTLEHSYGEKPDGLIDSSSVFAPKVPPGIYLCQRGMHELQGMDAPFETFEVTGVEGHSGILFHPGNTNADSAGCILLGMDIVNNEEIIGSRSAFHLFMDMLSGIDSFNLTII